MSEQQADKKPQKIVMVSLVHPCAYAGAATTVSIPRNADQIFVARIEADGRPIAIDKGQRSDGLLFCRKASPGHSQEMSFVPWSNVGEVKYGAGE